MSQTISISLTPDTTVTAVTVVGILRSDTSLAPAGVSLPFALSSSGAQWVGSFTDTNPPAYYTVTITTTANGIVSLPGSFDLVVPQTTSPLLSYFATTAAADTLAAGLPSSLLAAYLAAGQADKSAALAQATDDVDRGMRYQGRRWCHTQTLEFPRLAYGPLLAGAWQSWDWGGWAFYPGDLNRDIWDWDCVNHVAVVPPAVYQAVLYQANFILAGGDPRQDDIHGGVKSQGNAGLNESYDRSAPGADTGLCQRAWRLLRPYRLVSGKML